MAKKRRKKRQKRRKPQSLVGSVGDVLKIQRDYAKLTAGLTFGHATISTLSRMVS